MREMAEMNASLIRHALLSDDLNRLVVADENFTDMPLEFCAFRVVTNQYYIYLKLKDKGFDAQKIVFSDFDFTDIADASLDQIIMRLPKSKPVCFHILNESARMLKDGGILLLVGLNAEGVQTIIKNAVQRIGHLVSQSLEGKGIRFGCIKKSNDIVTVAKPLDDQNYAQVRPISEKHIMKVRARLNELNVERGISLPVAKIVPTILTKPGIYGFDKIDQGSEFLMTTLWQSFAVVTNEIKLCLLKSEQQRAKTFKQQARLLAKTAAIEPANNSEIQHDADNDKKTQSMRVLDLGCGYGYLSLSFHQMAYAYADFPHYQIVATDSNAGAVLACEANFKAQQVEGYVVADDCGSSLSVSHFELILCNPPFHQGFDTSIDLSNKFISMIAERLHLNGQAWVVVNRFLRFEQLVISQGLICERVSQNSQFSVFKITRSSVNAAN